MSGFELRGETTPPGAWLRSVWASRALVAVLGRKDFLVRYRRASLGVLWALGLPVLQAVVLAAVASRVIRPEVPAAYPVFVITGLVPAAFLITTVTAATTSVVDGASLSSRVYFPRAVLPLSTVVASAYAGVVSLVVLLVAVLVGGDLTPRLALLPVALVLLAALTVGGALVGSALHVWFRDVRYLLQAVGALWLYATPVVYPLDLIDGLLRRVVEANPATGVVELTRYATIGAAEGWGRALAWSLAWAVALLAGGVALHSRGDRVFADRL